MSDVFIWLYIIVTSVAFVILAMTLVEKIYPYKMNPSKNFWLTFGMTIAFVLAEVFTIILLSLNFQGA